MKRNLLKRIIALVIISTTLLTVVPIGTSASWKSNSTGWWYTEGSSWTTGWKNIEGKWYYFERDGYMKTGWIQDETKWYYLTQNGDMAYNIIIDGYTVGSDGAWLSNISRVSNSVSTEPNSNATPINISKASTTNDTSTTNTSGLSTSSSSSSHHHHSNSSSVWKSSDIVSIFYRLDDLSITMIMNANHTLEAYYGDDLSKKSEIEATFGVITVNPIDYYAWRGYPNRSSVIRTSDWNKEYKIVYENGVSKLKERTEDEQKDYSTEASKYITVFYKKDSGEITYQCLGKGQLKVGLAGNSGAEYAVQHYGLLYVRDEEPLKKGSLFFDIEVGKYKVIEENEKAKLVKISEDTLKNSIQITTSSAVTSTNV